MEEKEYYSIGEVSKICNISKKTLRFYDQIGLISPDKVCDDNNYRFYNRKTLLSVPIIKYYKQMGFKLEEMREFLEGNSYSVFERRFRNKIEELKEQESEIYKRVTSVKDWYSLIIEAESVIENNATDVAVKYIDKQNYCYMEQTFEYNYMESIINIDFTNYIEEIENAITGPVMILFPSFEDRMKGKSDKIQIMQKTILDCHEDKQMTYGGYMVASCYHIGGYDTIDETYKKIYNWVHPKGYECDRASCERYVTDYWTTKNSDQFVTEVLIKVTRN